MKISVLIPAFNSAKFLGDTIRSVLSQSRPADEILVMDDGSTDGTAALLEQFKPRLKAYRQPNQGVAAARNFLCAQAEGDILAFLDADDLWHPDYLKFQCDMIANYPGVMAFFVEHTDFSGNDIYEWQPEKTTPQPVFELINPQNFIARYDRTPLSFQMSCFCLRKAALKQTGDYPFQISGAEDTYLHNLLPLIGPVVHSSARLVAYRVNEGSLSSNRLKVAVSVLEVFKLLDSEYKTKGDSNLYSAFNLVHASRERNCGKYLMGSGRIKEARRLFIKSLGTSKNPFSMAKSLGMVCSAFLPASLQPAWPAGHRHQNGGRQETKPSDRLRD